MITNEYIRRACINELKRSHAMRIKNELRVLGVNNRSINEELDNIIAVADTCNLLAVNYMLSFIPDKLKAILVITGVRGAFASSIDSYYSLNRVIVVETLDKHPILFSFDHVAKCLYYNPNTNNVHCKEIMSFIKEEPINFVSHISFHD